MKKKFLFIFLSVSILSMAAGCSASKAEPENEVSAIEEQPETDESVPEDNLESEPETPVSEPEKEDEIPVEPESAQNVISSKIPLENGKPDENATAVMYYEFVKVYTSDSSATLGTLEFKIPQLTMRSVEAGMINEDILKYFEEQLDNWDETMEDFSDWEDLSEEGQSNLEISYMLTYLDDNKICLLLEGYEYNDGAAHGMPFRKPLIYNLENGERMDAEDLFAVSEDKFKDAFVAAFEDRMAESPDDFWADAMDYVKEGASFENEDFYLTENGTVFYFEPYVLAAYAHGYIEAEIPYDIVGVK